MIKLQDIMNEKIDESIMNKKLGALILSLLLGKSDILASPEVSSDYQSKTNITNTEIDSEEIENKIKKNTTTAINQVNDILKNKIPNQNELNKFKNLVNQDEERLSKIFWKNTINFKIDDDLYWKQLVLSYGLKSTDNEYIKIEQILQRLKKENISSLVPIKNITMIEREKLLNVLDFYFYYGIINKVIRF